MMNLKKISVKTKKMKEISKRLDAAEKKDGLDKANDLKEVIEEFKKLIKISDLGTVKELKAVVVELQKEVDRIIKANIKAEKEKREKKRRLEEID